jgi:hypothetical protein
MRSFLVLTEQGPLLTVTAEADGADDVVHSGMTRRGIDKYIAWEVPVEMVRTRYGRPFEVIASGLASDLASGRVLRVLDFDGRQIFSRLSLTELGRCYAHEH